MAVIASYKLARGFDAGDPLLVLNPVTLSKGVPAGCTGLVFDITKAKTVLPRACASVKDVSGERALVTLDNGDEIQVEGDSVLTHNAPANAIREASPRLFASPPGINNWLGLESMVKGAIEKLFRDNGYQKFVVDYDYSGCTFDVHAESVRPVATTAASSAKGTTATRAPKVASRKKSITGLWLQGKSTP